MQEEIEASVNNALGKFLSVKAVVFLCFYQVSVCVWGAGVRFRVQGSGFRVQGSGFRVQG